MVSVSARRRPVSSRRDAGVNWPPPGPLTLALLFAIVVLPFGVTDAKQYRNTKLIVRVDGGCIRGYTKQTIYDFPYIAFSGIPYAEPPVGDLRFKAPVPKASWKGLLDARQTGPPCPQVNDSGVYLGNEDCLYLNVYIPQQKTFGYSRQRLKVMVWIHGGGFVQGEGGSAQFGPDFIVERGVILVTMNYRLSVLGFLSLETKETPGNYGLKDQNLALLWVRRNIAAFGGDPDDVTLFGESAGGASVHYHLLSDSSRGLFRRAIAQSGSVLSPWAFSASPRQRALSLAEALGLQDPASDQEVLAFLSTVAPQRLLNNTDVALSSWDSNRMFIFAFVPSAEPAHPGAFLIREPAALMAEGRFARIPYITGVNSAEANFFVSDSVNGSLSTNQSLGYFDSNFDVVIGPDLRLKTIQNQYSTAMKIRDFYYGSDPITREKDLNTTHLLSDLYFHEGVDYVVRLMAEASPAPVRYYRFSYHGPNSAVADQPGVAHGDDLKYLFLFSEGGQNLDRNSDEGRTRDTIVEMWTNFAKYGDPTPKATELVTTKWKPYSKRNPAFLDINVKLRLDHSFNKERMDFWHEILPP